MIHVRALENGGEHHQRFQLAFSVHNHHGNGAVVVQAFLFGGGHHAAAVIFPVHRRRQPYVFIAEFFAVHVDHRVYRFKVEEQPFDGDARIRNFFVRRLAVQSVARFAAVAVDAEAYVV